MTQKPSPNFDTNRKPIKTIVILDESAKTVSLSFKMMRSVAGWIRSLFDVVPIYRMANVLKVWSVDMVMGVNIYKSKVFGAVVKLVSVDVMNLLNTRINSSSKLLLHYEHMNKPLSLIVSHVSPRIDMISTFKDSSLMAIPASLSRSSNSLLRAVKASHYKYPTMLRTTIQV